MKHGIAVVVTDGMGRDILETVQRIIESTGVRCEWEIVRAGRSVMAESGTSLPDYVLKCIKRNSVGLKLSFPSPGDVSGNIDLNAVLRRRLKLYANVCQSLNPTSYRRNLDVLVVRENLDGSMGVTEHKLGKDVAQCTSVVTRKGAERISHLAFDIARRYRRRKVILVHQINQTRLSDGIYLESFRSVAAEYPQIETDDVLLERLADRLIDQPGETDVLLVPPFYAAVVAGLCRSLAGQRDIFYEANLGDGIGIFECTGSLQEGEPLAVLKSAIMASQMMLRYLGEWEAADELIRSAVEISQNERTYSRIGLSRLNAVTPGIENQSAKIGF